VENLKTCFIKNNSYSFVLSLISHMERLERMELIKNRSFRCPESTWKRFKLFCLFNNVSCQDQLATLIEQYVDGENKSAGKESQRYIQSVSS